MEKRCLNCNEQIKVKPSQMERKKYCSRECKGLYLKKNKPNQHLITRKIIACSECGGSITRKPSEIRDYNFCNHYCKAQYQLKNKTGWSRKYTQVTKNCEECNASFSVVKARDGEAHYCSIKCLGKANGKRAKEVLTKKVTLSCVNCQKPVLRKPSRIKENNFCSITCMGEFYAESGMFAGENSGTWQGGDINYYGPNWRSQRRKARKRDNYTCQDCGITEEEYGQELSVHHKKSFRSFKGDWKSANRLSNLVSLCESPCHRNRHSKLNESVDDIV